MADTEYLQRTAVTGLAVEPGDRERLYDLVAEFRRGCQLAANMAWGVCHTRSEVQQLAYDELRASTELGSQHAVLATHRAAEAIKRSRARPGDEPTKPEFTSPAAVFDSRTLTVFDDGTVSLTTTGERVRCDLALAPDGYQSRYLDGDRWEPAESTLVPRDGEFVLHLGFRAPKPDAEPPDEDAVVLGVDLGVENLAVTSTAAFFPGGELAHRRQEFEALRAELAAADTRSAARTLKRAGTRTDRQAVERLHEVANGIVAEAERYGCELIAFGERAAVVESLPDAGPFHEWAFDRLLSFVEYRAAERGLTVVEVNPEYTSQRCMECGFTHPENRDVERNHFACLKCGNEANDDYNAAKNVAFRCVRRGPLSAGGVEAAACALNSGLVTPDEGFVPYAERPETPQSG